MIEKSKKVIVTGGGGFIGTALTEALVKKGYAVHVIGRSPKPKNFIPKATYHQADIADIAQIAPLFKNTLYVFHLASSVGERWSIDNPIETHRVNVDGTINVLIASQTAGVRRVVFLSSSAVYGDQNTLPHTENMMPIPKAPYGAQKYLGEMYCRIWSELYGLPTVSLRPFSVYGPRKNLDYKNRLVIDQFIKDRLENKPHSIIGTGGETRDFVHIDDVVRAILLASTSKKVGKGEVVNVGTGTNTSIKQLAELFDGEITYTPARFGPKHTRADMRVAEKLLGWKPKIKLTDGVKKLKKMWKI